MKKNLIFALLLVCFCTTGLATPGHAQDKGPAEIILKTSRGIKPAFFPHAEHQKRLKCGVCHHAEDADGKQLPFTDGMRIQKCPTCHNSRVNMPKGLTSFKEVAHKRCKGCHMNEQANRMLTRCGVCHKRNLK